MHILIILVIAITFYADYCAGKRRTDRLRKQAEQDQARLNKRLDIANGNVDFMKQPVTTDCLEAFGPLF